MIQPFLVFSSWGLLAFRVVVGLVFAGRGIVSVRKSGKKGSELPIAIIEIIGGALLVVGLFTQIVAALFVIRCAIVLAMKIKNGEEFLAYAIDLLLLAGALLLVTIGGGYLGLDRFLGIIVY